jgi:rare lipoprotein A
VSAGTLVSAAGGTIARPDRAGRIRLAAWLLIAAFALILSGCASRSKPPEPIAKPPAPIAKPPAPIAEPPAPIAEPPAPIAKPSSMLEVRQGLASYYGPGFHGKVTASGARFDMNAMVAAHPTYAFGTVIRVTNLANGRVVEVRVVDRGPARGPRADGVLIDLSYGAAGTLGFIRSGRTRVRLEVLRWGSSHQE